MKFIKSLQMILVTGVLGFASFNVAAHGNHEDIECNFLQKEKTAGSSNQTHSHSCEADFGKILLFSVVVGGIISAVNNNQQKTSFSDTNREWNFFATPTIEGGITGGFRFNHSENLMTRFSLTEDDVLDSDSRSQAELKLQYSF